MRRLAGPLLALLLGTASTEASACLWDRDTLAMERQQWPGTAEMIVGKFLRHSDALYEWRVQDRRARLLEYPDRLPLMDDLGVALDKLGRHPEAIAVAERALSIDPDRYETLANLGTFHAHAGELRTALQLIQRALLVNPDAHFGRERIQALLIEHIMQGPPERPSATGFADTVLRDLHGEDPSEALERARRGLEGMLRFGHHDSPVLLRALGDVLHAKRMFRRGPWPGQLAARAFAMAAMRTPDLEAAEALREQAIEALQLERGTDLAMVEYTLRWDLADANAWFEQIERDELEWIADDSVDPDKAFAAKYPVDPSVPQVDRAQPPEDRVPGRDWTWLLWIPAAGAALTVVLGRHHAMS